MKPKRLIPVFLVSILLAAGASSLPAWIVNGIVVCTEGHSQWTPVLASDGAGGAVIVWRDDRSGFGYDDIYAQRIDADAHALWTSNGVVVCSAASGQYDPAVVAGDGGSAIIAWQDDRSGTSPDIYAQRIGGDGTPLWTANGIAVCTAADEQFIPRIATDGAGGAIIVWYDYRNRGGTDQDIYVQRIDASGSPLWTAGGVALCTAAGSQINQLIVSDGAGGAVITWEDQRDGDWDIYAQRVDASGAAQWTADGVIVCALEYNQYKPAITADGAGGSFIAWSDNRSGFDHDIYAQRIGADGTPHWTANGVAVCTEMNDQSNPSIIHDGAGGAIIAWMDLRSGPYDICVQRVDSLGSPLWSAGGLALCTAGSHQYSPQIVEDGSGGAIVVWHDLRGGTADIYAQAVDSLGAIRWDVNGIPLCAATSTQQYPRVIPDGAGGSIVAWEDARSGSSWDIYAAKTDASGAVAVLLRSCQALYDGEAVEIRWSLSEEVAGLSFSVTREQVPAGSVTAIPENAICRDGLSWYLRDGTVSPGSSYRYHVRIYESDGARLLFSTDPVVVPAPAFALEQNYPNPFNPGTTIRFALAEPGHVRLRIYDVSGRLVRDLLSGHREAGRHTVVWDGRDGGGGEAASGVYFYRLEARALRETKKMILIR